MSLYNQFKLFYIGLLMISAFVVTNPCNAKTYLQNRVELTENFNDKTIKLDYTIFITDTVNRIRSQNLSFERDGVIPKDEQLEFCHFMNNSHICVDINYPVVWGKNGLIQIQKGSGENDTWPNEATIGNNRHVDESCEPLAFPENYYWDC